MRHDKAQFLHTGHGTKSNLGMGAAVKGSIDKKYDPCSLQKPLPASCLSPGGYGSSPKSSSTSEEETSMVIAHIHSKQKIADS